MSGNIDAYNYEIGYNLAFYDHLPVFLTIGTCMTREQNNINEEIYKLVDWRNFDRSEYCDIAESIMMSIDICDKIGCTENHDDKIDNNFDMILNALHTASEKFTAVKRKSFKPVPGRNAYCREKYNVARNVFIEWVRNHRPRTGGIFDRLKATRKEFFSALIFVNVAVTKLVMT